MATNSSSNQTSSPGTDVGLSATMLYVFLVSCVLVMAINLVKLLTLGVNRSLLLRSIVSPFIASLVVADMLVGFSMMLVYLDVEMQLLGAVAFICSHLHLMVIAVDRYIEVQLGIFLTTCVLLVALYSYLGAVALRHHRQIRRQVGASREPGEATGVPKATRMILAVLGTYIVLWAPFFACVLISLVKGYRAVPDVAWHVGLLLGVANSGINFFMYAFVNAQFRNAVIHLSKCRKANVIDSG
ncbi:hypothetical protein CAPTEDRAFT_207921 [Capitella teleta]|uniref:G-protein coupled receptors family 1 profile domain-containing protein n=1 Tax=Capitella teleta TaxID=283909 RepID=R7VFJ1_CAPTE|nr:hypothetical protein CAPTEDRAFT_207921 [Capitella teleta]|eukprot:ELU17608.1 hypothetical protein CAPTEDRAFT_207921 [Capitella teleta]